MESGPLGSCCVKKKPHQIIPSLDLIVPNFINFLTIQSFELNPKASCGLVSNKFESSECEEGRQMEGGS